MVLRSTIYPVSDSCNFRGLPPLINTFTEEKTRSEPQVVLIYTSPEAALDNAARLEPKWRRNCYNNAKGDAAELAQKICGKRAENMHDKHVIKLGK